MRPLDPQAAQARPSALVVLDVRSEEAYSRGHLAGSGNIPRAELVARRAELPTRATAILVVAERATDAREAAAVLGGLEYRDVTFLDASLAELSGGLDDRGPGARLWHPAPFLAEVLPRLLGHPAEAQSGPGTPPVTPRPRALDLAAGSGRDAVFLAQQGFDVEAWDHAPEALERARDLARRQGVRLHAVLCDVEQPDLPPPGRPFDLVICFRFLHRPLFPWIERALVPGGWLVYETFLMGQERFGRPRRPHFLLARGELARSFPGLVTVRYEEREPETGPLTARLLARKPPERD